MRKGVIGILSAIGGAATGAAAIGKMMNEKIEKKQETSDKHLKLFLMMNQWVETLAEELMESDIRIKYGIDKNADNIYADFDIVTPDSDLEKVDAIVVTPITFFDEIENMLTDKTDCPIISLEDILYQV